VSDYSSLPSLCPHHIRPYCGDQVRGLRTGLISTVAAARALVGSPAEFGKLIADETEKWAKVVKFANMKTE